MGKKPLVGLVGLVCAGIALTGCGETTRNNNTQPKFTAPSTFGGGKSTTSIGSTPADTTAKTKSDTKDPLAGPGPSGASVAGPGSMTATGNSVPNPPPMPPLTPAATTTQTSFTNDRGTTGSPWDKDRPSFNQTSTGNQSIPVPPPPMVSPTDTTATGGVPASSSVPGGQPLPPLGSSTAPSSNSVPSAGSVPPSSGAGLPSAGSLAPPYRP
jgi:hypothetical protein